MRLVIDLQACQTPGSRHRGIGRYSLSLAQAMVRQGAGRHDLWLALNSRFAETADDVRKAFRDLLPADRFVTFHVPSQRHDGLGAWRGRAAEAIRHHVLAEMAPDFVHVSSLIEGFQDDAVTSADSPDFPSAVTLYDLIPLMRQDVYLAGRDIRRWYLGRIEQLKKARLLLAISGYSRDEAIAALDLPADRVVNISSAIEGHFARLALSPARQAALTQHYTLVRPFIMYTGGIDHRKNIEGLIDAFALLPSRRDYQLAIVCSATAEQRQAVLAHAARAGLGPDEVVLTGFVSEDDLVALYNLCHLFVFPSLHEGFGLPALEAMACGAPVIGSDASSIPEVIGRRDALFDPTRPAAIAEAMARVLADEDFRQALREHGGQQAKLFSWDESARRALDAMEEAAEQTRADKLANHPVSQPRPRLAFVSPLPPEKTGIADYSAELLPALARHYDIELIVDQPSVDQGRLGAGFPVHDVAWFEKNAGRFDRILYQFGNSTFHRHMFALLDRFPGVVVLHDFYLSGIVEWLDTTGAMPGLFRRTLYRAHGYPALQCCQTGVAAAIRAYPVNQTVIDAALGVIVHSRYAMDAARQWYNDQVTEDWRVIPQLRELPTAADRATRSRLGFGDDDFVICSFGIVDALKSHERLLDAFLTSDLAADPNCHLVFVGQVVDPAYDDELRGRIASSPARSRIRITGYADAATYQAYLEAVDAAVQLRCWTRGETSRSVLDTLAHGLPLIVNACGPMGELQDDCLIKLPEQFDTDQLAEALLRLRGDRALRGRLSDAGRQLIGEKHDPDRIAQQYRDAIEAFTTTGRRIRYRQLIERIADDATAFDDDDLTCVSVALAANLPLRRGRQLMVDVTGVDLNPKSSSEDRLLVKRLLDNPPAGQRVEPIRWDGQVFRYATTATCRLLGLDPTGLADEAVDVADGDVLLQLPTGPDLPADARIMLQQFRSLGVSVRTFEHAIAEIAE